jgi:hypothetical protein
MSSKKGFKLAGSTTLVATMRAFKKNLRRQGKAVAHRKVGRTYFIFSGPKK